MIAVVLAALWTVSPPTATAPRLAVESLAVEGEMTEPARQRIQDALRSGLGRTGLEVVDAEQRQTSDYTLVTEVSVAARSYNLRLRLLDPAGGEVGSGESLCELCGFAEVATLAGNEAASIAGAFSARLEALPVLVLDSIPAGASIQLDGERRGTTPLELRVEAGRHRIRATKPGYFDQPVEVEAFAGLRQPISLSLVQRPPDRDAARARWPRPVAGVLFALGAAAVTSGGVLLAFHHKPYRRTCDLPGVDDACPERYDTVAGGSVLVATGVVSIVAATAVLIHARRVRTASRRKAQRGGR